MLNALHDRLRPILSAATGLLLILAVIALSSRPSTIRTNETKISTNDPGGEDVAAPEQGLPGDAVASPGAAVRRSSRAASTATGKVGSGAAPLVAGLGPGVTADSIKLGLIIVSNNSKVMSGYGVRGGAIGDTEDQMRAVVNDVNSRGILGRKIVPVVRVLDATGDAEAQFTSFCAAFTQDEKVFAVVSPWNAVASFAPCLAKSGTLYVIDGLDQADLEAFNEVKPYMATSMFSSSRNAVALARALHAQGFFVPGEKLGIVRGNGPIYERVSNLYFKPTLAALGVPPAVLERPTGRTENNATLAGDFAGADIRRIAFVTARGGPPLFFMNAAQARGYFPKYGLASPDGPAFLSTAAPYTQLQGAKGAGWAPALDVFDSEAGPFTPAEQRCLEVHKKQGTDYGTRQEAAAVAMMWCDAMWLFEENALAAGRTLNAANWTAALAKSGTSHQTPMTFGTNFSPGIFDGAFQYRPLAFDDSPDCRCFRYTGPPQNVPR